MTQELKPADITLRQLGGAGRLKAMIGAQDIYSKNDGSTLIFKFRLCPKATHCEVTLDADDTYTMRFIKVGRMNKRSYRIPVKEAAVFSGLYCDQLEDTFCSFTGLYLTLAQASRP